MEVRKGYKQTDFGVIPEDWDVRKLGELGIFRKGKGIKKDEVISDGLPCVRYGEIYTHYNSIIRKFNSFISEEVARQSQKIKKGDLLFAGSGETAEEIGKCVAFLGDFEAYAGGDVIIFTPHTLNSKFFGYFANYGVIAAQKSRMGQGDAVVHIYPKNLADIYVPLPPLPEQQAIAAALSDVDALLTLLEALIAKNRLIKQGAMQELLTGKKRLPGFNGEWKMKKIGEIAQSTAGGTPSTLIDSYWGGEIKWMSSGELHLKRVYDVGGRITQEGLTNSSTKIIPAKCVLIGLAGQGKTRGTVAMNMVELCTNQSIAAIFPSNAFIPDYLYFNLDSRYDELRSISTGDGGRGGLNLTLINKLEIPLPSLSEQTAIAEILSDMDAEITALEARREKTRLLKQGMMQELLTGRIRLI